MQDFLGMAVEAVVDPGLYLFLKLSAFFPLVVQFDGSDLNDLKRKLLFFFFLFHRGTDSIPGQKRCSS